MADADDDGNNNVFIYMGGNQRVPRNVRYVRVHKSVKIITANAFRFCHHLVSIEMHDGVEIIGEIAFHNCTALREIKLPGVRVIGQYAFHSCRALAEVEFGDKLQSIGNSAFANCACLQNIKIPHVRVIGPYAFAECQQLTDAKFSKDLETIGYNAFQNCRRLRSIAIPLKDRLLREFVFHSCDNLSTVNLVGGIHRTISLLLLDSWRNEMNNEIDRINRDFPNTPHGVKTAVIQHWMASVLRGITHYKSEHYILLKNSMTQLELALWKAKLDESQDERSVGRDQPAKKVKIDMKAARQEQRITSGADIVIKNVLPFLKLE